MTDTKIDLVCPGCGHELDGHCEPGSDVTPVFGDISICIYCSEVSIFGDGMKLRPPTEAEILELPLDEICRQQRIIRGLRERSE